MSHIRKKLHMRRALSACLALLLVLLMLPSAAFADETLSGKCGDKLTWTLDGDTLTIEGRGAMTDYSEQSYAPWHRYREQITTVILPDGLTSVGRFAFFQCSAITSVWVPDSVTAIGDYAFYQCSAMTMLHLGSGLTAVGEAAFRECTVLQSLRLPESLKRIDFQAFYRCEGITSVTIPSSVTEMDITTFAYCKNLVRANVQANITALPDWTFYGCYMLTDITLPDTLTQVDEYAFYGCEKLSSVSYDGSVENTQKIHADIQRDLEAFSTQGTVSSKPNGNTSSSTTFESQGDDVVSQTVTSVEKENVTVNTTVTASIPGGVLDNATISADVSVTLENEDGWEEIRGELASKVENAQSASVTIYVKDGSALPEDTLRELAGKDVTLTVTNQSGATWAIDCSTLHYDSVDADYDLSYIRMPATDKQREELGGAVAYQIKFNSDAQINAEIVIRLPGEYARDNAFLYQRNQEGVLERLQGVEIDNKGGAHFYLASVDSDTEYVVGINVPGEDVSNVIIPYTLTMEYGNIEPIRTLDYVVTGVKSSWGMNVGQVTWIMVGVLAAVIIGVGITMYALNKRKLKMGYVPDISDEDYE